MRVLSAHTQCLSHGKITRTSKYDPGAALLSVCGALSLPGAGAPHAARVPVDTHTSALQRSER